MLFQSLLGDQTLAFLVGFIDVDVVVVVCLFWSLLTLAVTTGRFFEEPWVSILGACLCSGLAR